LISEPEIFKNFVGLDVFFFAKACQDISQAIGFFFKRIFLKLCNKKKELEVVEKLLRRGFLDAIRETVLEKFLRTTDTVVFENRTELLTINPYSTSIL
jgi:hypothetical protein